MWRKLHVLPVCGMAGMGLQLAILGSAVRLTVDCNREPGLQKCGLFLRPIAKILCTFWMWATSWQNQQNGLYAQRRLISAWTSAQSDQSSHCTQWVAEDQVFLHADSEDSDQTGQTGCKSHFVGFVMRQLMYTLQLSRLALRASLTANPGVHPHIFHWDWWCAFFHW